MSLSVKDDDIVMAEQRVEDVGSREKQEEAAGEKAAPKRDSDASSIDSAALGDDLPPGYFYSPRFLGALTVRTSTTSHFSQPLSSRKKKSKEARDKGRTQSQTDSSRASVSPPSAPTSSSSSRPTS